VLEADASDSMDGEKNERICSERCWRQEDTGVIYTQIEADLLRACGTRERAREHGDVGNGGWHKEQGSAEEAVAGRLDGGDRAADPAA